MEAIDIYLMYCAFKAHFSDGNYDYFKYEGKTRIKRDSFFKRKDRFFFVRLSSKYKEYNEVKNYLLANFIGNAAGHVSNFSDKIYQDWLYRRENFYIIFSDEMRPLVGDFEPLFEIKNNSHPKLLQEYLGKRISLETLIILDDILHYSKSWNKSMSEDFIWHDVKKLIKNYKGFLTIDVKRYRIQLLKLVEESN